MDNHVIPTSVSGHFVIHSQRVEQGRAPIHLYTYTPIHLYTYTPIHLYTYTPIHLYTYTPTPIVYGAETRSCSARAGAVPQRAVPVPALPHCRGGRDGNVGARVPRLPKGVLPLGRGLLQRENRQRTRTGRGPHDRIQRERTRAARTGRGRGRLPSGRWGTDSARSGEPGVPVLLQMARTSLPGTKAQGATELEGCELRRWLWREGGGRTTQGRARSASWGQAQAHSLLLFQHCTISFPARFSALRHWHHSFTLRFRDMRSDVAMRPPLVVGCLKLHHYWRPGEASRVQISSSIGVALSSRKAEVAPTHDSRQLLAAVRARLRPLPVRGLCMFASLPSGVGTCVRACPGAPRFRGGAGQHRGIPAPGPLRSGRRRGASQSSLNHRESAFAGAGQLVFMGGGHAPARLWKDRNPVFPQRGWTTPDLPRTPTGQRRRNRTPGNSGDSVGGPGDSGRPRRHGSRAALLCSGGGDLR
eukprot:gene23909-biopygen4369